MYLTSREIIPSLAEKNLDYLFNANCSALVQI